MPKKNAVFFILITTLFITTAYNFARAETIDEKLSKIEKEKKDTTKKLNGLTDEKNSLAAKIAQLTQNLSATQEDINEINAQLLSMEKRLQEINQILDEKKIALSSKISLRNQIVRTYYTNNTINGFEIFLLSAPPINKSNTTNQDSSENLSGFQRLSQLYMSHKKLTQNTVSTIGGLNKDISDYETDRKEATDIKESLDKEKTKLASLKATLASQQASAQKELHTMEDDIAKLSSQLSNLTSEQENLIKEKFNQTKERPTVGDNDSASSSIPKPGFKPAFAFFTYGYPHRVGMNQYGAFGRSKAGQDYKQIIKAYFSNVEISGSCDMDKKIPVVGYGNIPLESNYMLGIAEMPESWGGKGGQEALKAQAILARTFALNYIYYYYSGGEIHKKDTPTPICTSQSCQVYNGNRKTGYWKQAVESTCGQVITYKGAPITAWFASTFGGYTRTSGQVWGGERPWTKAFLDSSCSDISCSYDGPKHGNSPWFHKAWGTNPSTGNAWLKGAEIEDILNAYLLSEKSSNYNKNLAAPSKGGWSAAKVKEELEKEGIKPFGEVKSVSMKDDGAGITTSVVISSANYSSKSLDGPKFRSVFNLRSPGTLVLWTGFYDVLIEK